MLGRCGCNDDTIKLFSECCQTEQYVKENNLSEFKELTIKLCKICGHGVNQNFEPAGIKKLYDDVPQTNIPVTLDMGRRISNLSNTVIKLLTCQNPRILEIGGGSSPLASEMHEVAASIDLIEPNSNIFLDYKGDTQISFFNDFFPSKKTSEQCYDLIIFRQVLEHTVSPHDFVASVRDILAPGGIIYCEVPSFEYILENGYTQDFHIQHVHYFTTKSLLNLFLELGLYPLNAQGIKNGHDIGVFFTDAETKSFVLPPEPSLSFLISNFYNAAAKRFSKMKKLTGQKIDVYGANSHALEILRYVDSDSIYDDTESLWGHRMSASKCNVSIVGPSDEMNGKSVLVAAYLHEQTIAKRVKNFGGLPISILNFREIKF